MFKNKRFLLRKHNWVFTLINNDNDFPKNLLYDKKCFRIEAIVDRRILLSIMWV